MLYSSEFRTFREVNADIGDVDSSTVLAGVRTVMDAVYTKGRRMRMLSMREDTKRRHGPLTRSPESMINEYTKRNKGSWGHFSDLVSRACP